MLQVKQVTELLMLVLEFKVDHRLKNMQMYFCEMYSSYVLTIKDALEKEKEK